MQQNDPDLPKYRVGMVARLTGLSTHTLRMWEKRYAAVTPARTPAGGRLYNDAQVERLQRLAQLVNAGHAIGSVVTLPPQALDALLSEADEPREDRAAVELMQQARDDFLRAIEAFDTLRAEGVLARAAAALAPREFIQEVVGPIMREVGQRWERGTLRVVHEHLSSSVLRGLLFSLARLYPPRADARTVVVGTCAGELHEIGAMNVAILASMHGLRVLHVGANLPADEYGFVCDEAQAALLLVSVVSLSRARAVRELTAVRNAVSPSVRMIAGGAATHGVLVDGVEVFAELQRLENVLRQ